MRWIPGQDTSVDKLSLHNQLQDLSLQLTNASLLGDADNVAKITARITQVTAKIRKNPVANSTAALVPGD